MKRAKTRSKVRSKSKTKEKGKARIKRKATPTANAKAKVKRSGASETRRVVPTAGRASTSATRGAPRSVAGIDLVAAGEIVQAAIPGGPHDIDSTLEANGLIT